MKSNHGGVQGKLPAGLTEVGVEQDGSTARKQTEEEAEEDERESNEDINNEEDDEGVNEIMNLRNCRSIITIF